MIIIIVLNLLGVLLLLLLQVHVLHRAAAAGCEQTAFMPQKQSGRLTSLLLLLLFG
jgi:hypothetical protein